MIHDYPTHILRRDNNIVRSRITKIVPVITKHLRRRPRRPAFVPAEKDKSFFVADFIFQPVGYRRTVEKVCSNIIFV